jgi:probable selenium-dependent hydroxylase accessory protein YqeC
MTLAEDLGLGNRECVALVGAGGKSTLLATLGHESIGTPARVVLTTTTRMAPEQIGRRTLWSSAPDAIGSALEPGKPLHVFTRREEHKVIGVSPEDVDRIYALTPVDLLVVEADGARGKLLKAPADHEPAIPASATIVVVIVGVDAVGRPAQQVAHRPELVAAVTGTRAGDPLTIEDVAAVLLDQQGGLKAVPDSARVVMAITGVTPATEATSRGLATVLAAHDRVDDAILRLRRDPTR